MRKINNIKFEKKKFVILVDGECEFWYLQMLKRYHETLKADFKPEIPQRKTVNKQFGKVCEYAKIYDKVFWIVDLDVIRDETRKTRKGQKTALQIFEEIKTKRSKNLKNVEILINNPCLEYWFLLHFKLVNKAFNNCDDVSKNLKKYLPDYEKTQKYFTKADNDIYTKLKTRLPDAIKNAKTLNSFSFENSDVSISEMYKFFEMAELEEHI